MTIQNLTKSFGAQTVIDHLNLELPRHGFVALMGPSGCGKTTLLQILAGLEKPDEGQIIPAVQAVSYAFQEPRLLPWRTVIDNVCLVQPQKSPAAWRRAGEILNQVGLGDSFDKYPDALSGGMAQRAGLARALFANGSLLLLDEPFRGLDKDTRDNVMEAVKQESRHFDLSLMVTHDREEALHLADWIVIFEGTPLRSYRIEKR